MNTVLSFARRELQRAGLLDNPEYKGDVGTRVMALMEAFTASRNFESDGEGGIHFDIISDTLTVATFNSLVRCEPISQKNKVQTS